MPRAHALQQEMHHNEKPPQWETHTPQLEMSPHSTTREKPEQQERPSAVKNK